jgi:hypothetical protein
MTKISCQKNAKNAITYHCEKCNFICSKKSNFDTHIMTLKHQKMSNTKKYEEIRSEKMPKMPKIYICICGNEYKHSQSLWNHKKSCEYTPNQHDDNNESNTCNPDDITSSKNMIKALFTIIQQQNTQIQDLFTHVKTGGDVTNNSHNTNHTNSHNKTFNLQFFLNETCKDAMNITDFVNSLKLTLQDLEQVGELGYAEGISRVFVKGLNDLEVTKRPIHCSDLKREVLHIKDKDAWEKDDNKDKLKKAIKDLSNKNLMLMDDWRTQNPGCKEYNNCKNDIYLKMMIESLGPADTTAEKKEFGKIIRTIAKNTIIDR